MSLHQLAEDLVNKPEIEVLRKRVKELEDFYKERLNDIRENEYEIKNLKSQLAVCGELFNRANQKMRTYTSIYKGDKELVSLLHDWENQIQLLQGIGK